MEANANINELIQFSSLPSLIKLSEGYEIILGLAEYDEEYRALPDYIVKQMEGKLIGKKVTISDINITPNGIEIFEEQEGYFSISLIQKFMTKTGLHSFLLSFFKEDAFIIGIELDFILIISPSTEGFISQSGGEVYFNEMLESKKSSEGIGLAPDVLEKLVEAVKTAQNSKFSNIHD